MQATTAIALAGHRGPELTLFIVVDDTTGTVAVLPAGENTKGYLVLLEGLDRQRGGSSATIALSQRLNFQRMTSPALLLKRTIIALSAHSSASPLVHPAV